MSRVERQRLQSDIWGAYWSQCYIPLSFFSAFFTSPWKGKNWNRDSDVAESVLFPSEKGCITQEVQDRVFFMLFWSYLFQFHWPWQTARCLHTLMTLCVVLGSLVVAAQTQTLFVSIPSQFPTPSASKRPQHVCFFCLSWHMHAQTCSFCPILAQSQDTNNKGK